MKTHVARRTERATLAASDGARCPGWRQAGLIGILCVVAWLPSLAWGAERGTPLEVSVKPEAGMLEIHSGARKLLVYAFARDQYKPYVKELYSMVGDNVLQDSPPDHYHHHGLMYAIRVNGINFWEEKIPDPGYQKPIRLLEPKTGRSPQGLPQARFTQVIHWVASKDKDRREPAAALMVERRTIVLTANEADQEVALLWRSDFEAGPAAARITLAGADYHGLGMRLPKSFDRVAQRLNEAGLPYTPQAAWDLTPARWGAAVGQVEGRPLTVAMFNHASNRADPMFFSMLNAFCYLAATQSLGKTPIEYAAGDKFSLSYLVTVHSAAKDRAFLAQRYEKFQKETAQR